MAIDYPHLRNIDLNLMLALDALVMEGSVSGAARRVGVGQPAMSHSLKRLRGLLNDPVLDREGKSMVPTERARAVAARVRKALHEIDAAVETSTSFEPKAAEETFRLGMSDNVATTLGVQLFRDMRRLAPKCRLRLVSHRRSGALELLDRRLMDVALGVFGDLSPWHRSQVVYQMPFVGITGTPFETAQPSLDEYIERPHVLQSSEDHFVGRMDAVLASQGRSRTVLLSTPFFHTIPFAVVETDAVALVPEAFAARFGAHFGLSVFEPPVDVGRIELRAVWHERSEDVPSHQWLRSRLLELQPIRSEAP